MTPLERLERELALKDEGHVIMWLERHFRYAAIKADGRWFTTATTENPYVAHEMDDHELAVHLMLGCDSRAFAHSRSSDWLMYAL